MCQRLEIRLDNGGEGGDEGKKQGGAEEFTGGAVISGGVVCVAGFIKHLQHFRLLTVGDRQTQVKKPTHRA